MKKITLSSNYNFSSGYGELLKVLLTDLSFFDYKLIPRTYSNVSENFVHFFDYNETFERNTLDLTLLSLNNNIDNINPFLHMQMDRPRILYTMWESTRVNDLMIEILNKFKCILVPNQYNKNNLIKQGCLTRIEVVPLFCDTDHFIYKPHILRDEFVFGISNEDIRKNIEKVEKSFIKTFAKTENVKLQIKTTKFNRQLKFCNKNIIHINKKYTIDELKNWYHNLDVYVSGATCEGWGMMQQESMCCGRPIIFTNYGGLSEFVNKNNGFEVRFQEVFAKASWGDGGGKWSEFDEDDMMEKMLYCYKHRDKVVEKGIIAANDAGRFTKQRFLKKLDEIITEYL